MDKKEIVRKLYEKGVLPSARELETLSEEKLMQLLGEEGERMEVLKGSGLSVRVRRHTRSRKISPQDFIDYYNSKYDKIRQVLLKKMDVISITNAKTDPSPCGIIGIVKGMTPAGFLFEDPTGEIEVVRSGIRELDGISLDDVFGLKGFVRENRFFPKEIAWPGIPINHRTGRIAGVSITLSGAGSPELTISENRKSGSTIQIRETPEWICISRGHDQVTILAFRTTKTTGEEAISYLERRCLPEPNPIKTTDNPYIMEEIPDILWLIQKGNWTETHRGVRIISCGNSAGIDLSTWEAGFEKPQPAATPSAPGGP